MQFCGNYEKKRHGSAPKKAPAFSGSKCQRVPEEERSAPRYVSYRYLLSGTLMWPRIQETRDLNEYILP